jgi:hypothetical protein
MPDYRLARTYEESGYRIDTNSIARENGKLYADIVCDCWKCGGKGVIPYYGYVDNGVCFCCGGSGKFGKHARIYTNEEREKMDAAAAAKKKRELEKQKAEAPAKRQAWLEKYNLKDGNIFIVAGCNTYECKDELKALGAKFYSGLGWFFGTETAPAEKDINLPETAFLFHTTVDTTFYWNEVGGGPYFIEGALEEIKNDIAECIKAKNKATSSSQHVGEVGERLRNMKGIFVSVKYFEGNWGGNFVYTFKVDDNIFTWFTQKALNFKENDKIDLTGTIKAHTEYNGILQTQLNRCIVKERGE